MEFISKIVINQGGSDDKKYCVTDKNYQRYFLRVCNKEKLNSKKFEFNMMQKIASLGVPMCKPIKLELSGNEVHSMYEWIEGKDARATILTYSVKQQYTYGVEAGRILQKIHSIPITGARGDWETFVIKKLMIKSPNIKNVPSNMRMVKFLLSF